MKTIVLLLALGFLPHALQAGGTKKKKRKFYIRREFVALGQMQPPIEYHNDSGTFHSLICKTTGLQKCGWGKPPLWRDPEYSLEEIERMVVGMMKWPSSEVNNYGKEGHIGLGVHLDIHWRRLPNGYEYSIEEGVMAPTSMDVLAARARGGAKKKSSGRATQ